VGAVDGRNISLLVLSEPVRGKNRKLEVFITYVYFDNVGGLWSDFDDGGVLAEK